ncbi:hypothetical protein ACNJD8_18700, partial [Mycobacterium tuberculosis]
STSTAATSRRSNSRLPTTLNARDQPPAEVSDQRVSGLTGAVQAPVFKAAGFRPNNSVPGDPPQPLGAPNYSQIRDDGVTINLVNGDNRGPLGYSYNTGCHLPAAWRTAPPPLNMRPANDPDVHYPYLYGSPGGRTRDAY